MAQVARGQLLRVLHQSPEAAQVALAARLGFAARDQQQTDKAGPEAEGRGGPEAGDQRAVSIATAPVDHRYWAVVGCSALASDETTDEPAPGWEEDQHSPASAQRLIPLPRQPLRNAGQWQNCWDQALPGRRSGRAIDLPRTVARLARGAPMTGLVRKWRKDRNQTTVLILDRTPALRPVWAEMQDARTTLHGLLGQEQLSVYFLPNGPDGGWFRPGAAGVGGEAEIPDGVSVVLMGAFGAWPHGRMEQRWRHLLRRLAGRGCRLALLPVCPVQGSRVGYFPVDGRPATHMETLLTALTRAWRPSVDQLRHLRLAIPGATPGDELAVYNHPEVVTDGPLLSLRREALLERLRAFDGLAPATKKSLSRAVEAWQSSLALTVREIEKLQSKLHRNPDPGDFDRLQALAARVCRETRAGETGTMAYGLMVSLLPQAELLADIGLASGWRAFLETAQQVALRAGRPLPLRHQGLETGETARWLRQHGEALVVTDDPAHSLLALGAQPYRVDTRRLLEPRTLRPVTGWS